MNQQTIASAGLKSLPTSAGARSGGELLRQRLRQVLETPLHAGEMTYEEFLAWADEDTLAEWVDGEVIMAGPASNLHQQLVRFLSAVLTIFVETYAQRWIERLRRQGFLSD